MGGFADDGEVGFSAAATCSGAISTRRQPGASPKRISAVVRPTASTGIKFVDADSEGVHHI